MALPTWMTIVLVLADWAIRIGLVVRVIMQRRPVPSALSWIAILLLVPVVGIVLYLLIGENKLGRFRLQRHTRIVNELTRQAAQYWKGSAGDWTDESIPYKPIATLATRVGLIPPLRGNDIELIGDTEGFLSRLIDDIDHAESHCHILTYIWMNGPAGERVGAAMIRAVERGVTCRVLVDDVGSGGFLKSRMCEHMRRAGVHVVSSMPVNALRALFSRIDLRNHRKIATIDSAIGYLGSHNITDESFKFSPKTGVGPWIDASARVIGPAAQAIEMIFVHDWMLDSGEKDLDLGGLLPKLTIDEDGSSVHIVPSMPDRDLSAIYEAVTAAIYMAREELIMTTPYFVPDEAMRSALRAAAMRGVAVEIVVPAINDSPIVAAASRAYYKDLLDVGAAIWHFNGGLLHAKTLTVDRHIGMIGSANFDVRSFWINLEASMIVYDSDVASHLRFLQKHYIQHSTRVGPQDWERRPVTRRFIDNTARLAGPLL